MPKKKVEIRLTAKMYARMQLIQYIHYLYIGKSQLNSFVANKIEMSLSNFIIYSVNWTIEILQCLSCHSVVIIIWIDAEQTAIAIILPIHFRYKSPMLEQKWI